MPVAETDIIHLTREDIVREEASIYRFINSLKEERTTFGLSFEKIMTAFYLVVVKDKATGQWLGLSGYRQKGLIAIFFLVIHRDAQGLGLGRRLTATVLRKFSPWQLMLLSVTRSNLKARRLYDAFGFETLQRGRQDVIMALGNPMLRFVKPMVWLGLNLKTWLSR